MFFLRRAHQLYKMKPVKSLSPSFWDSQGSATTDEGLDAIISGIEHPLGGRASITSSLISLTTIHEVDYCIPLGTWRPLCVSFSGCCEGHQCCIQHLHRRSMGTQNPKRPVQTEFLWKIFVLHSMYVIVGDGVRNLSLTELFSILQRQRKAKRIFPTWSCHSHSAHGAM